VRARDIAALGALAPLAVVCVAARLALSDDHAGRFIDVRTYPFPRARSPELRPIELRVDASLVRGSALRCVANGDAAAEGATWRVDGSGRLHVCELLPFLLESGPEAPRDFGQRVELVLDRDRGRWTRVSARVAQWIDVGADRWWRDVTGVVTLSSEDTTRVDGLVLKCALRDARPAGSPSPGFGEVREPIDATWTLVDELPR
jgi:hypothetical protein